MLSKPFFEINLLKNLKKIPVNFDNWIKENHIVIMNVAGPIESEASIYDKTFSLLMDGISTIYGYKM